MTYDQEISLELRQKVIDYGRKCNIYLTKQTFKQCLLEILNIPRVLSDQPEYTDISEEALNNLQEKVTCTK